MEMCRGAERQRPVGESATKGLDLCWRGCGRFVESPHPCRYGHGLPPGGQSALLIARLHEVGDGGIGGGERLLVRKKYDPEVPGSRLLPEA